MKWVTREKVKVDRVACPWLIKRFIDPDTEFLFVPSGTDPQSIDYGIIYDMKGIELGHYGDECPFDAFMKRYDMCADPALVEVQKVVRGADTGNYMISPMSETLVKIAEGFGLSCEDNYEVHEKEFPLYDALYAYFKSRAGA